MACCCDSLRAYCPINRHSDDDVIDMVNGDQYEVDDEVRHEANDDNDRDRIRIAIDRPTYTSSGLQKRYGYHPTDQPTLSEYIRSKKKQIKCDRHTAKKFLYCLFPVTRWFPKYDIKKDAIGDVVAGITVGIVNVPQSMAFALLAVLPPVYGLYTAFFPALIFFLMGSSRHNSVGAFAVISMLCGDAVEKIIAQKYPATTPAPIEPITYFVSPNSSNATVLPSTVTPVMCDDVCLERVKIHTSLCLLVGIIQLSMAVCRLGFVAVYLAQPLVRAFTTGAACHVITSQVPPVLGLSITRYAGPLSLIYSWIDILVNLPKTNVATLLISLLTLVILAPGKFLSERYRKKIKIPIPVELIVVIITILISHFGKVYDKFGVDIIQDIPIGFPTPSVPSSVYFSDLIGDAFAIALVGFAISISLAKIFATKNDYDVNSNQELMAYGASNAFSSFFSCFVSASALARVSLLHNNGGKTQLAMVVSSVLVMLVLLVMGPLFEPLPKCVLAVIIIVALKGMMSQFSDLKPLFKTSKVDCSIWVVTWLAVLLLGVVYGLIVGVAYAMVTVIGRTQFPGFSTEGRLPGSEFYRDPDVYKSARENSRVKVFKMQASLYYANAEQFKRTLYQMSGVNPVKTFKKLRKTLDRQRQLQNPAGESDQSATENPGAVDISVVSSEAGNNRIKSQTIDKRYDTQLEWMVIDCSHFDFIDVVGAKTLATVAEEYGRIGISVVFAACSDPVLKSVRIIGQFDESSRDYFYPSVHDAITSTVTCEQTTELSGISQNALIFTRADVDGVETADVVV